LYSFIVYLVYVDLTIVGLDIIHNYFIYLNLSYFIILCLLLLFYISYSHSIQPKQVTDIKEFLELVNRKDTRSVVIKKNPENVKFKARTSRYLITLVVKDSAKAEKLIKMLPNSVQSTIIN
jgi:large subunit ribosomal protein L38e